MSRCCFRDLLGLGTLLDCCSTSADPIHLSLTTFWLWQQTYLLLYVRGGIQAHAKDLITEGRLRKCVIGLQRMHTPKGSDYANTVSCSFMFRLKIFLRSSLLFLRRSFFLRKNNSSCLARVCVCVCVHLSLLVDDPTNFRLVDVSFRTARS